LLPEIEKEKLPSGKNTPGRGGKDSHGTAKFLKSDNREATGNEIRTHPPKEVEAPTFGLEDVVVKGKRKIK